MDSPLLNIILIEDNEADRLAFKRSLEHSDLACEIVEFERAEEVLADLHNPTAPQPDLVVVDYDLPGVDGLSFFKSLNQKSPRELPPFVMLTGAGTESLAAAALKAGMYDYVVKDTQHGYLELLPVILGTVIRRHRDDRERIQTRKALQEAHDRLETRVAERTSALAQAVVALEREITERKNIEEQLRSSHERLRALSHRILQLQENDRQTVAKELHDSIGASLAAIKFSLENRIAQSCGLVPHGMISMEIIVEHLRQTLEECRRVSAFLRPPLLDELGLLAAIKVFCQQMDRHYPGVKIVHQLSVHEKRLDERLKIVVYRIIQEALNNALKHSGADTVRITLMGGRHRLNLYVVDNGHGFDADFVGNDAMGTYGLQSMRERAVVCNGVCRVETAPGKGTTVSASFPLGVPDDAR